MKKLSLKLVLLLVLPAATGELLQSVYNVYVPIYLQAGGAGFDASGAALTFGFGFGAALVGFWLTADNIFAFLIQPIVGAWSDRTRSRLGRRLPFLLVTLPLIVIGYAVIPLAPTFIPQALNGQHARLVSTFIIFTSACMVYYLGYMPARSILQTLRQEVVEPNQRSKIEAAYFFLYNVFTILAYTLGGKLYELYGPLIFWCALALYIITTVVLLAFFREPQELSEPVQEESNLKQLLAVFKGVSGVEARSLYAFLASAAFYSLVLSAMINFGSSWAVNVLGVAENKAASIIAIVTVAATVTALPAGFIGGTRFGRRNLYVVSLCISLLAMLLLVIAPHMYVVGFVFFGIGMGGTMTAQLPLASEVARRQSSLGAVVGVYNFAYMFGFLLGANVMGWIIQATSYSAIFPTNLVFTILALVAALFVRTKKAEAA